MGQSYEGMIGQNITQLLEKEPFPFFFLRFLIKTKTSLIVMLSLEDDRN